MKLIAGKIVSGLITLSGWLLLGARLMLDLIGYSTAPEDVAVAKTRLDQALGWFLTIPWWALLGFALISTLWLMWVSWPRLASNSRTTQTFAPNPEETPPAPFTAKGLYIARAYLDLRRLTEELYFILSFIVHNATGQQISVLEITGNIDFRIPDAGPDPMKANLSSPLWRRDNPKNEIPNLQEFMVVMEQRVPPDMGRLIMHGVEGKGGLRILLDGLNVIIQSADRKQKARLPLWAEISARKIQDSVVVHRVIMGSLNVVIS